MKPVVIGIDIGGTKVAAHLSDGMLWSSAASSVATPPDSKPATLQGLSAGTAAHETALAQGRAALLDTLTTLCRKLMEEAESQQMQVQAIGIGTAGQVDSTRGLILDANENLVGWKGTALAETLSSALGRPVYVDNDVRTLALAETTLGAGREYDHVFCMAVGTGIGGAIVLNKSLWHGAHFSAGEIGYLYAGNGENIEERYAGPSIAARYSAAQGLSTPLTLVEMAQRARQGDASCSEAIRSAAHELGQHIAPVLSFLDPQALVVGGGVPEIGPLWWDAFTASVHSFHLSSVKQMPILKAELGPDAGRIGAALMAARLAGLPH